MAQAQESPNTPPTTGGQGGTLVPADQVPAPAASAPGWTVTSAVLLAIVVAAVILALLRFRSRGRR